MQFQLLSESVQTGHIVANALNGVKLDGVISEMVNVLPIVLPVMVSFIAVRKGIGYLQSVLHSA